MKDLSTIPENEHEHFMKCCNCNGFFDKRDLSSVFFHEGDCLSGEKPKDIEYSSSKKVGDSELHLKNHGTINLN